MVWGAIHHGGKSELVVLNGTFNHQHYIRPLYDSMLHWAMGVFEQSFLYDHDNSTPHIICDTAAFLVKQNVEVMDWTAQSTDMYPIKHVWDEIGVWVRYLDDPPAP